MASRGREGFLHLRGVRKTYWLGATPVHALRGVNLTISEGEFVAIMGPSGSGKSTLMHVLGLLDVPDEGTLRVLGQDTGGLDDNALAALRGRTVGFVFQQFNLLSRMTARDNIELPLLYGGGLRRGSARTAPLARTFGLSNRLEHRPGELSGGQQQRVAIARALVNDPKLILADEPTGNLDSHTQREIMDLLCRLNRSGLTIVLVTHEEEVARYARRVIWMRDGAIRTDRRQRGMVSPPSRPSGLVPVDRKPADASGALDRWRSLLAPVAGHVRAHVTEAMVSLQANKVRAGLSTLGIAIGVGAVIAMLALGIGARRSMAERMAQFGTNVISVHAEWYQPRGRSSNEVITRLTAADATALLRAHPAIRRTAPMVWSGGTLTWEGRDWSPGGLGVTAAYENVRSCHPIAGRFFTADEDRDRARVLLLGTTVVRQLFGEGVNPVGQTVRLNKVPFTVIGLLPEKPGFGGHWDPNDNFVVPLGTAMYRMSGKRYVDSIDIELEPDVDVDEVIDRIKSFLATRYRLKGGKEDAFDVRNEVAWRQAGAAVTNTVTLLLGIVAAISLAVGGIGIMNIMLVSVTERTREIGLRKAVGARRNDILNQFLIEAVTISVGGGILGITLGCTVAFLLAVVVHWTVAVTPWSVLMSFGFSAAVGVGFGFWPAWRAAALHPAEALRYE